MLPSGFEPEFTAREAVMIGRTTLWEQIYPPDATCIIVNSSPPFNSVSIGIGLLLFITINVSGFILIFFRTS